MLTDPDRSLRILDKLDAEQSLRSYIPLVWPVIEPGREFITGWAVDAICEHLQGVTDGHIRRLVINVPPGCMKSLTTDVLWPTWEWGPRNRPQTRYVCASYSEALTVRDNLRTRRIILSDVYQELWGDRFRLTSDQNAKVRFDNDKTGFKIATSVGGLGTGERGDRFIIDDPHNVKEAESEARRESSLMWFAEVVPTRVNDPERSAIIVIMQRVHDRDVSGMILKQELGYEWLCLPMEYEERHRCFTVLPREGVPTERVASFRREGEPVPRWLTEEEWAAEVQERPLDPPREPVWRELTPQDRRSEEGELLWPARFTRRHLDEDLRPQLRAWGGSYAEAGQLQQRPAPREGGMFQRADFQYLDSAPEQGVLWARGWDLASSKEKNSPWTAGCKIGLWKGRVVIADMRRRRASPGEVEDMLLSTARADGHGVMISIPQDPGQAGKSQKAALARLLHGWPVHFSPETGSKEDRARAIAAQCGAGNVWLVRGPWNDAFLAEACLFPNGEYKDQVDALSRGYARLTRGRPTLIGARPEVVTGAGG